MHIDLEAGALVMVPNDARHVPLRGVLGQVIGKGIEGRYRVQLDIEFDSNTLTGQVIELALELGMVMGQDFVIIPKHNHAMVLKAKRAYNERGESLKDY